MTISSQIISFLVVTVGCIGFGILVNIPRKDLFPAAATGATAWIFYEFLTYSDVSKAAAAFLATCLVALLSEILSRLNKEAATIYVIPGIIPLVPGAGAYYTMTNFINANYDQALIFARDTLFAAGSIALALLVMGSFTRIYISIKENRKWS
jgi:uncharacterized membrane protein YjjB (DUF3815 family)